jgi:predicted transcriptional regulator YdeE
MTTVNQPTLKALGALKLAGLFYEGTSENGEIPMMWDVFIPRVGEIVPDFATKGAVLYGACRDEVSADGSFQYLAAADVGALDHLPQGFTSWDMPAKLYAVLPVNDLSEIRNVVHSFYHDWLPSNQEYVLDGAFMLEVYPRDFDGHNLSVYFPVKHK